MYIYQYLFWEFVIEKVLKNNEWSTCGLFCYRFDVGIARISLLTIKDFD